MSVQTVCTGCGMRQSLEAGLVTDDAKLLAAATAEMDPKVARVALVFLRLFKPPKSELRLTTAAKLLRELQQLIASGRVSPDERSALERPTTPAMWIAGMEQMLAHPPGGQMGNHNYLRKVVYGMADQMAGAAERAHEANLRAPRAEVERPTSTAVRHSPTVDPATALRDWCAAEVRAGRLTREQVQDKHGVTLP